MQTYEERLKRIAEWQKKNHDKVMGYQKKYRLNHRGALREESRRKYRENPQRVIDRQNRWIRKNPKKYRLYIKEWHKNHIERVRGYKRKWKRNNKDKCNESGRRIYRANPQRGIQHVYAWRSKYPEKYSNIQRARKARFRAAGAIKPSFIAQLRKEQPFCAHCGKPSEHLDHIIPICQGGTNERSNLQMLCARCNCKKATKERTYLPIQKSDKVTLQTEQVKLTPLLNVST